jgi:hypothetical protein
LVLDVVGSTARHTLITASEIFDLKLKEGQSVKEAVIEGERLKAVVEPTYNESGQRIAAEVNPFHSREMRWIQTNQGAWVLSLGSGYVLLSPAGGERWVVHHVDRTQSTLLFDSLPLDYAM